MELQEVIKQMGFKHLRFAGKAKAVFSFFNLMATTNEYKPGEIEWSCILTLGRN